MYLPLKQIYVGSIPTAPTRIFLKVFFQKCFVLDFARELSIMITSYLGWVAESTNAAVCKTDFERTRGLESHPSLQTTGL